MSKINNVRLPNAAPQQYSAAQFDQLIRSLEQIILQLNSTYGSITDVNSVNAMDWFSAGQGIAQGTLFDSLDFNTNVSLPDEEGRLVWNTVDETLNLGMAYDVVQQIGQEYYARVGNTTGSTIPNGSVVGFAGATANALLVAPYLADGNTPSLYMLGVMTHSLPDSGDKGYATVWGFVRDLDTSAFNVGDILYASPTTAGALSNVKPTAPNNVIPVAACIVSDATNGVIFVRPTVEQQLTYGVFSDTTTFTPGAIYTPYAITFNTTDYAKGFSRGTPTSRIVAAQSGLYNFQFSAQVSSGNSSQKKLWIWPRINGVDVPNSNSEVTVKDSGGVLVPAWNWVVSMTAGQYFEIMYAVDDINMSIVSVAAQTGTNGTATFARPGVPSIILTVTQVQQ